MPNTHYHAGMKAGENTLNALLARVTARAALGLPPLAGPPPESALPVGPVPAVALAAGAPYSADHFLAAYVAFMTTPGTHNDTYAETHVRQFFGNLQRGRTPAECADNDGHNTDSAGGLVSLPVPALLAAARALGEAAARGDAAASAAGAATAAAAAAAKAHLRSTHKSPRLEVFAGVYAGALAAVLGAPAGGAAGALRAAAAAACAAQGVDLARLLATADAGAAAAGGAAGEGDAAVVGGALSPACYIADSLPALLFLAARYADAPAAALLANTNVGGENCHRGAALGALVGAAHGAAAWPAELRGGLADAARIEEEAAALGAAAEAAFLAGAKAAAVTAGGEV